MSSIIANADCWIIGDLGKGWVTNDGVKMEQSSSANEWVADLTDVEPGQKWFNFTTQLTDRTDDWGAILEYRFGGSFAITSGKPQRLTAGSDASPSVTLSVISDLHIVFNTSSAMLMITITEKGEAEPFDANKLTFYITGADYGDWSMPPAMMFENNGNGTHSIQVTSHGGQFKIAGTSTEQAALDWGLFNMGVYGTADALVEGNNTLQAGFNENMTMTLTGNLILTIKNVTETSCVLNIAREKDESVNVPVETVVDFATLYGNAKVQPATEVTAGSLTISFAKGNASTEPAYFVSDDGKTMEMRLYGGSATATAGNTMTITSTANITAISIDGASASKPTNIADLTVDAGTISVESDRNATWSGNASSVTITVVRPSSGAGQYRFKTMTVTTGGSGEITVAKPTFSVAAGTYYAPISVEMKCGTAGASIYYTTNGSEPSASSSKYSAPVTISANTTLKAIAVLNGKQSDVAEAVYEFGTEPPVCDGITVAEFNALEDNAAATMGTLTALAQSGQRLFAKDNTGYMLIFGNVGQEYGRGAVIPAGGTGTKTTYNGEPELKDPKNFQASTSTVQVTPETLTAAELSHDMFGHLVQLKNATFSGSNIVSESGVSYAYYNYMGATIPGDSEKYDAIAIVGSFGRAPNTVYQLLPVEVQKAGGGEVEAPEVANVDELYTKATNINYKITSDLVAIFQNGNYLYVKNEDSYALVFGKLDETFANGDVISGAEASWKEYNQAKQLTPVADTFVKSGTTSPVQPEEMAFEEISTDMAHMYIIAKGATIYSETDAAGKTTTYINDADQTMPTILYDQFFKDATIIPTETEGKTYTVKGFVDNFKGTLEIFPIEVIEEIVEEPENPLKKYDVNEDGWIDVGDINDILSLILSGRAADYAPRRR